MFLLGHASAGSQEGRRSLALAAWLFPPPINPKDGIKDGLSRLPGGAPITVHSRASDGLWSGPGDGKNNGVSAVLALTRLDGFALAKAKTVLVHNPWARLPYAGLLDRLPHARVGGDGKLVSVDGESLGVMLDLPVGWATD